MLRKYNHVYKSIFHTFVGECSLYFLASVLPEVQAANVALQREYTTGVSLHRIITTLLSKLNNRLHDEYFGAKVSQLMEDYPVKEVENLKSTFNCFIQTVITYIEKYYNKYKLFYRSISIFDEIDIEKIEWKHIQNCSTFVHGQVIDEDCLYNDFNHIKCKYTSLKEKFGDINAQVEAFITSNLNGSKDSRISDNQQTAVCNECEADNDLSEEECSDDGQDYLKFCKHKNMKTAIRSDYLWAYLLDGEDTPNLRKLVEFVFAIPASNAYCESIFSHMKYLWTNNRNRMKHELVGAELKIKLNTHLTCTEFYNYLLTKPDLLKQIRSSEKYSQVAKLPQVIRK